LSELILSVAVCCLRFQMYQAIANGSKVNSQKKPGFKR
jgi:hypothetical protein